MARVVKALGVKEVEKISKIPGVHAVGGVPGLALRVWASAAGSGCAWILLSTKRWLVSNRSGLRVRVDSSH